MEDRKQLWLTREHTFAAFATGPLVDFWQQREEDEFTGVGRIPIRYVRFISAQHDRAILLCPGRIESYMKYAELAYDLYQCGFDVFIIDHRGQGKSGRLLADTHRGHVNAFSDYVDDVATLYEKEIATRHYQHRYALAHSMGGAILALMLARNVAHFDAAVLVAPMLGIPLPLPSWLAWPILNWAEKRPDMRENYAVGTGEWQPRPFENNHVTHSLERYRRSVQLYVDDPVLRMGGPTYHWVRESILAGEMALQQAANITVPLLLLQAGEENVVENAAQERFCQAMQAAGKACMLKTIAGARHEILFEQDEMRAEALASIVRFFDHHCDGARSC